MPDDTRRDTRPDDAFVHCKRCLDTKPAGQSMREYASIEVSVLDGCVRVWCKRHDELVMSLRLHESAVKAMGHSCTCARCRKGLDEVVGAAAASVEARDDADLIEGIRDRLRSIKMQLVTAMLCADREHHLVGHWAASIIGQAVSHMEGAARLPDDAQKKVLAIGCAAILFACEEIYPGARAYLDSLGLADVVSDWRVSS